MLLVHHLNDSRSQRILWLLEELHIPYEIKKYRRLPSLRAPPELLAVNPLGKSPVITDDGKNISESGAIIGKKDFHGRRLSGLTWCGWEQEYIIRKYGQGQLSLPAEGTQGYIDDLYFLHYSEGTLMPILVNKLIYSLVPTYAPWFIRWFVSMIFKQVTQLVVEPELEKNIKMLESHVEKKDWFAGGSGPTAADFSMCYGMESLVTEKLAGPAVVAYVKRMQDRPAYKKALERGGEYSYAAKL